MSLVAAVISATATLAWLAELATRPPCPNGYVRLIDVAKVGPVISGFLFVTVLALWTVSPRRNRAWIVTILVATVGVASLALLLVAGIAIVSHSRPVDNSCWTF